MSLETPAFWKKCGSCKNPIGFGKIYYLCSVSSCQKKSNPYVFCSVTCWDVHVPILNHKNAWAEENTSPSLQTFLKESGSQSSEERTPRKVLIKSSPTANSVDSSSGEEEREGGPSEREILIVASKLKNYIRDRSGFNTSASVMDRLSDMVRVLSDKAIENARLNNRKTVMDRDFDF